MGLTPSHLLRYTEIVIVSLFHGLLLRSLICIAIIDLVITDFINFSLAFPKLL